MSKNQFQNRQLFEVSSAKTMLTMSQFHYQSLFLGAKRRQRRRMIQFQKTMLCVRRCAKLMRLQFQFHHQLP